MAKYIYDYPEWPQFTWRARDLSVIFGEVRHLQGRISGQMNALGFSARETATLDTITQDVLKSSEIEGEFLDYGQVRSSVARRLGINEAGLSPASRHVEGVVEMMLDATRNYASPLTHERLHGWHAALFPTGYSGLQRIEAGRYRTRVMQIVSGPVGRRACTTRLFNLLDGFEGKLQSSKWAKITKTSPDTALRDIRDLVEKGILTPGKPGGRSTGYSLVFPA